MSHDFQTHNIWMQHDATYNICGVQCTDLLASTAPLFSAVLSDKLWFCRDSHTFCLWPCKSWLQLIPFSANLNWRSFPFQQKHSLLEFSMVHLGAKCTLESIFIFLHCKRSRKKLSFINSAGIGASNISISAFDWRMHDLAPTQVWLWRSFAGYITNPNNAQHWFKSLKIACTNWHCLILISPI